MKWFGMMIFFVGVLFLSGIFVVYGSAEITLPSSNSAIGSISFAGANQPVSTSLRPGCSTLVLVASQSTVPDFAGKPAILVYGCSASGVSAFSTSHSNNHKKLSVTPTFALPSGWSLSIGVAKPSGECSSGDQTVMLTSGTLVVLSPNTGYIYCLTTSSSSSFSRFSVTWSA